ncbi:hypothetical protein RB653_009820 [Dictyostelium firmibasis]|uniref:Uncharacterized protein n=1 Tax=Dictyostelium firmibasis TaxID=79012 RepID=A0AAN7YT83_9MYCE
MKLINFILIFTIFLSINNNFVNSVDQCEVPIQISTENSCGNNPSRAIIYNYLDYFDSFTVTPNAQVSVNVAAGNSYWNLKDDVPYTFTFRYKNCSNYISQLVVTKGMYYELLTEPLCQMTQVNFTVHNWGLNGGSYNFTGTPSLQNVYNQMGQCNINFYIYPKSNSKGVLHNGAVKYTFGTCGFKNGSISIDFTKGYTKSRLFNVNDNQFANEIKANSTGLYKDLGQNDYFLFLDSTECGTERIRISLNDVFTPMEINYEYVPNLIENSIISLSLSSGPTGVINNTNVNAFFPNNIFTFPLGNWTHKNSSLGGDYTYYGYSYNSDFSTDLFKPKCYYGESLKTFFYYPYFNFTVERNESCLNNVTITFYPSTRKISIYDNDEELGYPMTNNVLSIPYNKNLYIYDEMSESNIYYSTVFTPKPSYFIVESSNGTGCWKTYNITIGNYEIYSVLKLQVVDINNDEFYFYPIDGVFVNVPANNFKILYTTENCTNPSYFRIDKSNYNSPIGDITIKYTTLSVGNCTSPTLFTMSANTTLGFFTSEETESYSETEQLNFNIPTTLCGIPAFFYGPKLTDERPLNFVAISDFSCNSSGNPVQFKPTNGYYITQVFSNGVQLSSQTWLGYTNCYFINSGVNNVTVQYSGPNGACYGFKTINVQSNYETPIVQVSPVTDCNNGDGKIVILNYQNFTSLNIVIGGYYQNIISGVVGNLSSNTYSIVYNHNQTCSNSITVTIPTLVPNVDITTSIINNPTCFTSNLGNNNADGSIKVNLKINNVQINNFDIENQNPSYTFRSGVYGAAGFGINSLKISYGSCVWNRDVNVTVVNTPQFSLQKVLNDTCYYSSSYKLINNNPNVVVSQISRFPGNYIRYQNEFYFQISSYYNQITYSLNWNDFCYGDFTQEFTQDEYYNFNQSLINYQIVKADNCSTLKIDLIITNMNLFSALTLNNKSPTSINSTHAVFKNLPPSSSYYVYFDLPNGCSLNQEVGFEELSSGFTKEKLNVNITNDICYSGKGSIDLLSTIDTENYYYSFLNINGGVEDFPLTTFLTNNNNNNLLNLKTGTYNISRTCKNITNCFISTSINIKSDNPSIESVIINHSYGKLNNGSVEVKLNYNSSYPITYELVGTKLSNNNGKFINLSPKDYQLKITITDRMCPVTLSKTFTVKLISLPSTDSSEELSTSSFVQTNLLLLSILILTIILL